MKATYQYDLKNNQYPSAYTIAKRIADVSSGNWEAKVYSEISNPENHDDPTVGYLRRSDNLIIRLEYDCSHTDPGKLKFSYVLPYRTVLVNGNWKTLQRHRSGNDLQGDTINIGTGKTPAQMLAEVLRRLVPYANMQHLKDVEFFAEQEARIKREQAAAEEFEYKFALAGFEPVKGGNGVWFIRGSKASVDMQEGGHIKITTDTRDTAKAVAIVEAIELILAGKQLTEVQPHVTQAIAMLVTGEQYERLPLFAE